MILSSNSKLAAWQIVLFSSLFCLTCFTGLLRFFQGLRMYRDYRINRDTAAVKVHNLAPGLVKVRGKAECAQLLLSPFSRTPCCLYKTKIEYLAEKGPLDDNRYITGWRELRTDVGSQRFFVADETGRILVDAPKMFDSEIDGKVTFDDVVDESFPPLEEYREKLAADDRAFFDEKLNTTFFSRHQPGRKSSPPEPSGKPGLRVVEWVVQPGDEYLVIGNYGKDREAQDAGGYIVGRRKGLPFGISHRIEKGDDDWGEVLRSQARSTVLVGVLVFFGGMLFLVPLVRYLMNRQGGIN